MTSRTVIFIFSKKIWYEEASSNLHKKSITWDFCQFQLRWIFSKSPIWILIVSLIQAHSCKSSFHKNLNGLVFYKRFNHSSLPLNRSSTNLWHPWSSNWGVIFLGFRCFRVAVREYNSAPSQVKHCKNLPNLFYYVLCKHFPPFLEPILKIHYNSLKWQSQF